MNEYQKLLYKHILNKGALDMYWGTDTVKGIYVIRLLKLDNTITLYLRSDQKPAMV